MWAQSLIGPGRFEMTEIPAPSSPPPGQVKLRTLVGGICGSDLPYFRGLRLPATQGRPGPQGPGFPMHEIVGEVVESAAAGYDIGDRVVGWASGFDGMSELILADASGLHGYTGRWSPATAVTLQPLACVIAAVERLGSVEGLTVAVVGQGPIGLLFSHVVRTMGAKHVIGVDRLDRAELAPGFRVDEFVHQNSDNWAATLPPAARPDIVIEAVGHQAGTVNDIVEAVRPGGRIYYFGVPDDAFYAFPIRQFLRKNLTMISGVTLEQSRVLSLADRYLADHPGLADSYVTDIFPIAEAQTAFQRACAPAPVQVKVTVSMS